MIARLLKCCFILVISPHLRADSHNDLPWNIRKFAGGKLNTLGALETGLQHQDPWSKSSWSHTDLPRLREGRVGAQVTFVHWPLVIKDFHKLYGPGPKTRQQAYTHVKPHHSISSYNHVIWFIIELKLNAFAIWIAKNGRIVRIRIECGPIRNGFTFYFYCWMSEEEWPSHAVTSFSWPCLAHGPKCIFIHLVSFSFFLSLRHRFHLLLAWPQQQQFWAAYVPCGAQYLDAVKQTLEQIDLIKRMVDRYSDYLRLAVDAKGKVILLPGRPSICPCPHSGTRAGRDGRAGTAAIDFKFDLSATSNTSSYIY